LRKPTGLKARDSLDGEEVTMKIATELQGTPSWFTPAQAAAHLGLPSVRALYQVVRRGQVPAHRLGRRLRFRREELDRALAGS